jgi:hypothetical protein
MAPLRDFLPARIVTSTGVNLANAGDALVGDACGTGALEKEAVL